MPIRWEQITSRVWAGAHQDYFAVVIRAGHVWTARVEDGAVQYPAPRSFRTIDDGKAWAECTICALVEQQTAVRQGHLALAWGQRTATVWIADHNTYRAVILFRDGRWVARIEHGIEVYTSSMNYSTLSRAQAWAERKLTRLLEAQ